MRNTLYSIRNSTPTDIYQYDVVPSRVRIQLIQLIRRSFGEESLCQHGYDAYREVVAHLRLEYGVKNLRTIYLEGFNEIRDPLQELNDFLENANRNQVFDVVELWIEQFHRSSKHIWPYSGRPSIYELTTTFNRFMRQAGVGYQIENEQVIRMDEVFVHDKVLKPALVLLKNPDMTNANLEFMKGLEYYREGDFEGALTEINKSVESVLKVIATQKGWIISTNDTMSNLLRAARQANYIESYEESVIQAVASIRNKNAAHGKGIDSKTVDEGLVQFQINIAASSILCLLAKI